MHSALGQQNGPPCPSTAAQHVYPSLPRQSAFVVQFLMQKLSPDVCEMPRWMHVVPLGHGGFAPEPIGQPPSIAALQ